ncbi:DUF5988 family protein [Streptomyces lomondensis]|uniref:Uncharacterized protein n=1 Tax=Streptomyces lomondensis TaxID=68229 RepID=A0ABQ2XXV6_9ACTN|nr:DUF5988 family protein [Streptomyces lomondensis]MCF0083100.1 DUF5988 family protein [Streptomyces lomondensis]GGX36278.1 hypothetical protein GCM10010383_77970 [Streptomyces lomondensis]
MNTVEPNVILRGGASPYLTDDQRIRYVEDTDDNLKLLRGNRYEHFEPTAESETHDGMQLRVFVWLGVTKLAE